jgi:hypothetical protein
VPGRATVRFGLITFGNEQLREVVEQMYLSDPESKHSSRTILIRFFERQEFGARKLAILPRQLALAGHWESLGALLSDPIFLEGLRSTRGYAQVKAYWALVEANSSHNKSESYAHLRDSTIIDPTVTD